jgi:hypothetical protein
MILAPQLMPATPMPLLPFAAAVPAQCVPCGQLASVMSVLLLRDGVPAADILAGEIDVVGHARVDDREGDVAAAGPEIPRLGAR